jgi:ATPase subunit of ABC transporter with duplicated ATPase domains
MAQALFKEPEVLLLDEPTNHLDIVATYWLEKFLINEYRGVLLMVSHDHDFLNNVATDILDLDYGRITGYKGNYDKFVVAKELAKTQKDIEIKENQRKIAHMQKFVDKNKAKASKAKQAMSRVKMIAKIKSPEALQSSRRCPNFKFQAKSRSGKQVVAVKDIWKSFNDRFVLAEATFNVNRGDKVAIIGPNGIGKSTLLKIMMNKLAADNGTVTWGHNVAISYFAQDHHERIKQSQSLLSWLQDNAVTSEDRVLRTALGNMLFTKDEVDKDVAVLSGGEVARLLFAEIQLAQNNVLVLDEPTNHLDMETIHGLAAALKSYEGTVIAVSHDRHFINSYCNRVIGIAANKVVDYCVQDWQDLNDILDKQCAVGVDLRVGPV